MSLQVDQATITERLRQYPMLNGLLGGSLWVQSCLGATTEWHKLHPAIQWLHHADNHAFLPRLEECIRCINLMADDGPSRGGYKEFVHDLQDKSKFLTALPKLYLTTYLLEHNHPVAWPPTGPDILLDSAIYLEITSLQKTVSISSLRKVLSAFPYREFYDVQMSIPEMIELSVTEINRIEGELAAIGRPQGFPGGFTEIVHEILVHDLRPRTSSQALTITVRYPGTGIITNMRALTTPIEAFTDMIWNCLYHKSDQFARSKQSGTVLIQVDNADPGIYSFVQHDLDDEKIEAAIWAEIPEQIQCAWLCSLDLEVLEPRQLRFTANPKCSDEIIGKYDALRRTLSDRHKFIDDFRGPLDPSANLDETLNAYFRGKDFGRKHD